MTRMKSLTDHLAAIHQRIKENAEKKLAAQPELDLGMPDLAAPALKPPGWDRHAAPASVTRNTDLAIYELHVRDFSITDDSVPEAYRGKYAAFTRADSRGMQHLAALARASDTPGPVVVLSTAHAAKFPEDVAKVAGVTPQLPRGAADLADRPERFERLPAETEVIKGYVRAFAQG